VLQKFAAIQMIDVLVQITDRQELRATPGRSPNSASNSAPAAAENCRLGGRVSIPTQ
jgi:hypothetical protein